MYLNSLVYVSIIVNIQYCMKSLCFCASMHNGEMWQLCTSLPPSVAQQHYNVLFCQDKISVNMHGRTKELHS